jgi:hypothetical protein
MTRILDLCLWPVRLAVALLFGVDVAAQYLYFLFCGVVMFGVIITGPVLLPIVAYAKDGERGLAWVLALYAAVAVIYYGGSTLERHVRARRRVAP